MRPKKGADESVLPSSSVLVTDAVTATPFETPAMDAYRLTRYRPATFGATNESKLTKPVEVTCACAASATLTAVPIPTVARPPMVIRSPLASQRRLAAFVPATPPDPSPAE